MCLSARQDNQWISDYPHLPRYKQRSHPLVTPSCSRYEKLSSIESRAVTYLFDSQISVFPETHTVNGYYSRKELDTCVAEYTVLKEKASVDKSGKVELQNWIRERKTWVAVVEEVYFLWNSVLLSVLIGYFPSTLVSVYSGKIRSPAS